jgi:hypothetical protein
MNVGADQIVAAGKKLADNGYAGIVAAPESRTIGLYWLVPQSPFNAREVRLWFW